VNSPLAKEESEEHSAESHICNESGEEENMKASKLQSTKTVSFGIPSLKLTQIERKCMQKQRRIENAGKRRKR
jgi:hypothetical protein